MADGTVIDLSRVPFPDAIDPLDSETLITEFKTRFLAFWAAARAIDGTLPMYDVEGLETDPLVIAGEAFSFLRLTDRARVNDAVKGVLAPTATGADLDYIAAGQGVTRLLLVAATADAPAIYESDDRLRLRYWLSFNRASAGSRDGILFEAYTAWPSLFDARVVGQSVHGRLGDVELVVTGPGGATPNSTQIKAIRDAVTAPDFKPEATAITVIPAIRATYTVSLVIQVPTGPDPSLVVEETRRRVEEATLERLKIGASLAAEAISGAAYGPNVIRVIRLSPVADIPAVVDAIPVCSGIQIVAEIVA